MDIAPCSFDDVLMNEATISECLKMVRATIAAVTITKNEARNIRECLESVRWADEIGVVDAESRDRTAELAKAYTPKGYVRPWPGYGPQKNLPMDQPTAGWI